MMETQSDLHLDRPPGQGRRETRQTLLVLGLVFFLHVGLFYRPSGWLYDPSLYYAYVRSPVIDGDFSFCNEAQPKDFWAQAPRTPTGLCQNVWSVGPALAWAPFFLLGHAATLLADAWGLVTLPADGYSAFYLAFVGVASAFYGYLGMLLVYRLLRRYQPHAVALLTTAIVWMSTPVFFYTYYMNLYAHALSLATVALFILLWDETRGQWSARRFVVLGLAAGLMALMRWQNALFLVLPAVEIAVELIRRRRAGQTWWTALRTWPGRLALLGAAAVLVFSPQMAMWRVLYGKWLTVPQGGDFMQWTTPHLFGVLVGSNRGLVWWQPVAVLGLAGLLLQLRRHPFLAGALLLAAGVATYVNSVAGDWWGGGGFGPRRFDALGPILAWGLAGLLAPAWRRGPVLRVACLALGALLFVHQLVLVRLVYSDLLPWELYIVGRPIPPSVFIEAWRQIAQQPAHLVAWPFFEAAPFFDLYGGLFGPARPPDLGRSTLVLLLAAAGPAALYAAWLLSARLPAARRVGVTALGLLALLIAGLDAGILVVA